MTETNNSAIQRRIAKQFQYIRKINPEKVVPLADRHNYSVEDLKINGIFCLDNSTYMVLDAGEYRETSDDYKKFKKDRWQELKCYCLDTGTNHNLEFESDDELEVSITMGEINFDIQYENGNQVLRNTDDLDEIADKEEKIIHNGIQYAYEDDYAAKYSHADFSKDAETENAYFYEFIAKDNSQLTIEVWIDTDGKEEFQVFLSKEVDSEGIEIISTEN